MSTTTFMTSIAIARPVARSATVGDVLTSQTTRTTASRPTESARNRKRTFGPVGRRRSVVMEGNRWYGPSDQPGDQGSGDREGGEGGDDDQSRHGDPVSGEGGPGDPPGRPLDLVRSLGYRWLPERDPEG
jgi:hypothetical protein